MVAVGVSMSTSEWKVASKEGPCLKSATIANSLIYLVEVTVDAAV